jgi:hypothetical protein
LESGSPPGLVGRSDPSHGTKCRPQNDHTEKSDLAKTFFIARWERERAKRERERERRVGA